MPIFMLAPNGEGSNKIPIIVGEKKERSVAIAAVEKMRNVVFYLRWHFECRALIFYVFLVFVGLGRTKRRNTITANLQLKKRRHNSSSSEINRRKTLVCYQRSNGRRRRKRRMHIAKQTNQAMGALRTLFLLTY